MKTHCDVCRYQGASREAVEKRQGVAVCHDHRLDIHEGKLDGMLWVNVRIMVGVLKSPRLLEVTQQRDLELESEELKRPPMAKKNNPRMLERTAKILEALVLGQNTDEIAAEFNVDKQLIYAIRSRYSVDRL